MKFLSKLVVAAACAVAAPSASADNVTFTYQGRVNVNGTPYTGSGQFKFAILNNAENKTLWTNDGTVIGEPAASVSLPVQSGVFSVAVGDPSAGMSPINSAIFSSRKPLKLRIWVNCGGSGFEQLSPDQKLVDLTLNTVSTGDSDYTIFVNGTLGDDENNGLTTGTAKKTIQAAVDIVPPRLRCTVTIKVAPGDYKESVRIFGISSAGSPGGTGYDGDYLKIVGDGSWTTASLASPTVRIMGADIDSSTATRSRLYALSAHNCSAVSFESLWFDLAGNIGAKVETGSYLFKNCKATRSVFSGYYTGHGAFSSFVDSEASSNGHGFSSGPGSQIYMTGDHSYSNTYHGVNAQGPCDVSMYGANRLRNNGWSGVGGQNVAVIGWGAGGNTIQSNGQYGIEAIYGAISRGHASFATFTGNVSGNLSSNPGGSFF